MGTTEGSSAVALLTSPRGPLYSRAPGGKRGTNNTLATAVPRPRRTRADRAGGRSAARVERPRPAWAPQHLPGAAQGGSRPLPPARTARKTTASSRTGFDSRVDRALRTKRLCCLLMPDSSARPPPDKLVLGPGRRCGPRGAGQGCRVATEGQRAARGPRTRPTRQLALREGKSLGPSWRGWERGHSVP